MEANELMIGDWVLFEGTPATVRGVEIYCSDLYVQTNLTDAWYMSNFEPIPLTPEILEKNGFDVVRGNRIMGLQVSDRCTLRIGDGMKEMRVEMQDWGETEERKWFIEIRNLGSIILQLYIGYIHELQHALRLCRIEKEIVL